MISKVLCSRLKESLPNIISPSQSAFIEERSIVQNILICHDLVRLYNRKATTSSCLIKIDLKKAYDSVEWVFVKEIMMALNYHTTFIQWVMECITTTSYSLEINGGLYGNIEGKRGLRQGAPISPLIFVICMEYLARIMEMVGQQQGFAYHPKCKSLGLNHLCFRDDVLLFCKGEPHAVMLIRGLTSFS